MMGSSERASGNRVYRAGVAVALVTSVLVVWSTIVRDDGNGIGFFLILMAAGIAGFAAGFRPAGMARAMVGIATMQVSLGVAIATAPMTANLPGGASKALLAGGFFAALWLISALCFAVAATGARKAAAAL